jgi:hypothetical protein
MLNLTDACWDLVEQLKEVKGRLGTVQAKATFQIHALEAKLQDGNLGLRLLVRMTSTKMDGRLGVLRALGRAMMGQAAKLKERNHELISMEGHLRRTRRDVKNLKRQNKKVSNERQEDVPQGEVGGAERPALPVGGGPEVPCHGEHGNQVGRMMGQLEGKDGELLELWELAKEKEGEILELREELDRKEHEVIQVENQLKKV